MAVIKFQGNWQPEYQKGVPKGFIVLKPKDFFLDKIRKAMKKLMENQKKSEQLRDLEITIDIHYKKRSLDQNNLMWALYEIEANEINGGLSGSRDQTTSSEELYLQDLEEYAERIVLIVPEHKLELYKLGRRIIACDEYKAKEGVMYYRLEMIESSSFFTTKQMTDWIERQFNRIAINGVECTNPGEIPNYWLQWKQHLNDNKIILRDDIVTGQDYKALNPLCEASGEYIGDGSGQLAHIKARGMGGNPIEEKDYSSNWLHLSNKAHIEIQHKKGWKHFLKLYPHLRYKVETAQRREYPKIQQEIKQNTLYDPEKDEGLF